MSSFTTELQREIRRIARREVKAAVEPLRVAIRALRREVAELEAERKQDAQQEWKRRHVTRFEEALAISSNTGKQRQKGPESLWAWRKRAGLSAAAVARLLGVSGQTFRNWESGSCRAPEEQQVRIAALRAMGRHELLDAARAAAERQPGS